MIKFTHTFFFLFAISFAFAQSDTEIITFGDDNDYEERKQVETLLIIKTNPLSMISGRQFVEVEKPLTDFLTIEGGAGLTFSPAINGVQSIYTELFNSPSSIGCSSPNFGPEANYCDQDDYSNFNIRSTKPGVWLTGSLKFYFYNDAPDDFYISLNLRYSTNRFDVQKAIPTEIPLQRDPSSLQSESVGNLDYTVRFGFQSLYSPLVSDFFIGIGLRRANHNRLDIGFDGATSEYVNAMQEFSTSRLLFESGVRLGFEVSKNQKKKRKRRR